MYPGRPSDTDIAAHLAKHYGAEVTRLSLPEGHNPFVLRVGRGVGPDWVARLFNPARPRERAEGEAEILRYLERHEYPAERCAADQPVTTLGGWTVLVTRYAGEGAQENRSLFPRLQTDDALLRLGDLLGRLHTLPAEPGAVMRPGGAWHGDPRYEGLPSQDIAATTATLDEIEPEVPPKARAGFDTLRSRVEGLARWRDELPSALVHPDFMWKNIVVNVDGDFVPVDWTGAGRGPRVSNVVALANAAVSDGKVDQRKLDAIVGGYRRHVELTGDELSAVADARRIGQLRFVVISYQTATRFGHFATGQEQWWPSDDENVALEDAMHVAFSTESRT